jgi:aminopeptidase N
MHKRLFLWLLTFISLLPLKGQDHQQSYETIDVLSYQYFIGLFDRTDEIIGIAEIEIAFKKDVEQFQLDLTGPRGDSLGMKVGSVTEDGHYVSYLQQDDHIILNIPKAQKGTHRMYRIGYGGIPTDGLIISKNKFGDRTFFGDNWPDRGHNWLPMVDHPSDKALVEFDVTAPDHYRVVSVGEKLDETKMGDRIMTRWKTSVPISTKLMVIGVSPFAVDYLKSKSGVPVSSWVYPQNREEGFRDYSIAIWPLDFFETYIAPYPYKKLANVQSKTVYGGMENASCIFYNERSVDGRQDHENLFAHEIAHQWYGDGVSELDWHHIWLSEGFATYLTDIYIEHAHGHDAMVASLQKERERVIRFAHQRLAPIVDTTLPVSIRLLNRNSYQKAGWVLHMLRHEMGDELFQQCVRVFYEKFKFSNALTEDFQEVVDSVTGKDHEQFFQQWFYQKGYPVLSSTWKQEGRKLELNIRQHQEQYIFTFPLEVKFSGGNGRCTMRYLDIHSAEQTFYLDIPFEANEIILDPGTWLLFEPYEPGNSSLPPG